MYGIHWFRRDLRLAGNAALRRNFQESRGRTLGLFCFDSKFLARPDFSHARFAFFLNTLKALRSEMQEFGGDLLVIDGRPQDVFPELLRTLSETPSLLTFNRDYEPFARKRDEEILAWAKSVSLPIHHERDHLIFEPNEVLKDDGSFYQVFTPYARKWYETLRVTGHSSRVDEKYTGVSQMKKRLRGDKPDLLFQIKWTEVQKKSFPFSDALEKFDLDNRKNVSIPIPEAGSLAAFQRLKEFAKNLESYGKRRDLPAEDGTSKLSMFLKNGSITTAQIIAYLNLKDLPFRAESGANKFLKELVWREFYYSILWHAPNVEGEAFLPQYRELKWGNNEDWFKRWCLGTTGFPIVDAGMRQLNQTGWMHNRVRMIVASFLCKDLLIDWRWGERYFMQKLLDGDLASNNGGWQWAASTGCDPQPYFRIFNPLLQSKKFDPEGEYIRTYIPELSRISQKDIHAPTGVPGYPEPVVDHSLQRDLALRLYKSGTAKHS